MKIVGAEKHWGKFMFKISLPLSALRDPNFTQQMQLSALEHSYCQAFSFLDTCELPVAADKELRRRLDALLALALGINVTTMPPDQFEIVDIEGLNSGAVLEHRPK